jgi:hypothetical protein
MKEAKGKLKPSKTPCPSTPTGIVVFTEKSTIEDAKELIKEIYKKKHGT